MAERLVAITGATGQVGGRVAAALAGAGVAQRLLVRDPIRAPHLRGAQLARIRGYDAGDEVRDALVGAETLFLVPAHESPTRVDEHRSAIDAAVAAGVRRIVYLSFLGASPTATFTLARDHDATERLIRATGVPFTFLRMNLYMDFIPSMVGEDGVIRGPAGDGRVGAILRSDVAAAAAAVLRAEDPTAHDGATYDLTGPHSFTLAEAAAALSQRSGRPVRYQPETREEAYASRVSYGAPEWEVDGWVTSYLAIASGELDVVSGAVRTLLGREPASLQDYLASSPTT